MKVSVIIPVYNVSAYITTCIDSVVEQSYSNLEIILVNDGSTDSSGEICHKRALLDNRIKYYEKENGGLSSARNYGLDRVTGDFVYFLDSDDFLVSNAIELLVAEQIRTKSDIVSSALFMVGEKEKYSEMFVNADFVCGNNNQFFYQNITNQACGKLYKKQLFENITYPEGLHYEDVATTFKLYDKAVRVSHTNEGLYCYRMREGAITHIIKKQDIEDLCKAYKHIKEYFVVTDEKYLFYELTVLYTIYSRLLRSNCKGTEFRFYKKKIYNEVKRIDIGIREYKGKSNMYYKLLLFKLHLTKCVVRVVDLKRKISNNF